MESIKQRNAIAKRVSLDQSSNITSVDFDIQTEKKQKHLITISEQDDDASSMNSYAFSDQSALQPRGSVRPNNAPPVIEVINEDSDDDDISVGSDEFNIE